MSTGRIWRNAAKVADEYTQRLQAYLLSCGYPEEVTESCEIRVNPDAAEFFFHTDSEEFWDYEYGDGDEMPPLGAMRNFFFQYGRDMTALVEQYLVEELSRAFSI